MKANRLLFGLLASGMALAGLTQSCVSDEPFAGTEGEGSLRMKLVINSDLTRAVITDDADLRDSCVVYITRLGEDGGIVQKYKGLSNIPSEILLKSGNYALEAWTGDSVPASFDDRFYRGYKKFAITDGNNTAVALTCKIANVAVSVNPESTALSEMNDWTLTVSNTSGTLDFDSQKVDVTGFFMMPNADIAKDASEDVIRDEEGWPLYTNLKYHIEGTNSAGERFEQDGLIGSPRHEGKLVEHAHEYRLNLKYNPEHESLGGSFITIEVDDTPLESISHDFGIYSAPSIKGVDFNIDQQVVGQQEGFSTLEVKVSGFNGLQSLVLYENNGSNDFNLPSSAGVDLIRLAGDDERQVLKNLGITWTDPLRDDRDIWTSYITFSADLLNSLNERDTQYLLNIKAVDGYDKTTVKELRIAVGEAAVIIESPITIDDPGSDLLSIRARKATLTGRILNAEMNPQIQYRKQGLATWTSISVLDYQTRSDDSFSIEIANLEPGTTYQYRIIGDEYTPDDKDIKTFTTETEYSIPNGNLEEWITYGSKKWDVPTGGTGQKNFWDNGNQGASTLTLNNICAKTQEKVHSGSFAAKLETKRIMGQMAAGNLFVGDFLSATISPLGAKLTFGKPYDRSHPEAMRVWAHYTPKKINEDGKGLTTNDMDRGQIYVALVNGAYSIDTGNKIYFERDNPQVLGYGEKVWSGTGTSGDSMEELIINIEWKDSAKTIAPTHIVIVCSASMYGDYFVGGTGSVMYVDDFELVY